MSTIASQIIGVSVVQAQIKGNIKAHVTGLCEGNSMATGEFSTQKDSNAENVSIW